MLWFAKQNIAEIEDFLSLYNMLQPDYLSQGMKKVVC